MFLQVVRNRLTFTIKLEDLKKTRKLVENNKYIKFRKLIVNRNVSKVSIVGVGMVTTPGITYRMFRALAKKKNKYRSDIYIRNQDISSY